MGSVIRVVSSLQDESWGFSIAHDGTVTCTENGEVVPTPPGLIETIEGQFGFLNVLPELHPAEDDQSA